MRVSGSGRLGTVVCVNGGQAREVEGTWSASVEWLVRRLAPRIPELTFAEVRYRVKSWNRFGSCVEDARAAVAERGAERVLLLGFSMGGAVAIASADDPSVTRVLGLAPWIPDDLDLDPLAGKSLVVLHGALDRWLPGIPGVSPGSSRRGFERAMRTGCPRQLHRHSRSRARPRAALAAGRSRPPTACEPLGRAGGERAAAVRPLVIQVPRRRLSPDSPTRRARTASTLRRGPSACAPLEFRSRTPRPARSHA